MRIWHDVGYEILDDNSEDTVNGEAVIITAIASMLQRFYQLSNACSTKLM